MNGLPEVIWTYCSYWNKYLHLYEY